MKRAIKAVASPKGMFRLSKSKAELIRALSSGRNI